jgi:hypothetical protein
MWSAGPIKIRGFGIEQEVIGYLWIKRNIKKYGQCHCKNFAAIAKVLLWGWNVFLVNPNYLFH